MTDYTESYDTAQVCLNGHVINDSATSSPEKNAKHCVTCGEPTVNACPSCSVSIRGSFTFWNGMKQRGYTRPSYCHECGQRFEWTQRTLDAALELFLEDVGENTGDAEKFRESLDAITRDSPRTAVASSRLVKMLGNIGKGTAQAIRDIMIEIASETAKKIIWPEP